MRIVIVTALAAALLAAGTASAADPLRRPADPVVVTGGEAKSLRGSRPDRVVAFSYSKRRHPWQQVPVQVDERANVDLGDVYDGRYEGITIAAYTDPETFTGPDPDPRVDADDEIATMARYATRRARRHGEPAKPPKRVRPSSAVELKVKRPGGGGTRWLYLFSARSGALDPAAGEDLVDYDFELLSGDYRATYRLTDGPNPERSTIRTPFYRLRFTDRWINDLLAIRAGEADRSDILDRRNAQLRRGDCGRSVDTFTDAEGAFIVNRDGPVRAIRSYVGANSGPLTQREHVFYERSERVTTYLRVHPIPGVIDFWDYSPQASGMTYRSSTTSAPVTVDGMPDQVPTAAPEWEQLSGEQGTVTQVQRLHTDADGLALEGYYLDQGDPNDEEERQCTGDGMAFAASGSGTAGSIPNTDPRLGPATRFIGERTVFYDRPGLGPAAGARRSAWVERPLELSARRFR